jgi:hypothetical protein
MGKIFSNTATWLAKQLIIWYTQFLPEMHRERYRKEFLADIDEIPDKMTKLDFALRIVSTYIRQRAALNARISILAGAHGLFNATIAPQFPQSRKVWMIVTIYTILGFGIFLYTSFFGVTLPTWFTLAIFFVPLGISFLGSIVGCASGIYYRMRGYTVEHGRNSILLGYNISRFGFGLYASMVVTTILLTQLFELINKDGNRISLILTGAFLMMMPIALFGNAVSRQLLDWKVAKKLNGLWLLIFNLVELGLMVSTVMASLFALASLIMTVLIS